MSDILEEAHQQEATRNKPVIEKSTKVGCFYCLSIYDPKDVKEYVSKEETAVCPNCGIDSVIGDAGKFPVTLEFLKEMHEHWFNTFVCGWCDAEYHGKDTHQDCKSKRELLGNI